MEIVVAILKEKKENEVMKGRLGWGNSVPFTS